MNDYLWDGSGEADPEIERLEAVLRPLGYVPSAEPLSVVDLAQSTGSTRRVVWYGAIAASVAFMALAVGLWFSAQGTNPPLAIANAGSTDNTELIWTNEASTGVVTPVRTPPLRRIVNRQVQTAQARARIEAENREGRMAAAQLLKALQITSDQLNIVRTKVRQTNAPTPES
jgi:hypothetical protein